MARSGGALRRSRCDDRCKVARHRHKHHGKQHERTRDQRPYALCFHGPFFLPTSIEHLMCQRRSLTKSGLR